MRRPLIGPEDMVIGCESWVSLQKKMRTDICNRKGGASELLTEGSRRSNETAPEKPYAISSDNRNIFRVPGMARRELKDYRLHFQQTNSPKDRESIFELHLLIQFLLLASG